ncbi:MAG: DUF2807 domain-containing protein [Alphaproteobacteria bacterium]|nr:DUF2807 domain-containing protein [Alphaproteobacteria bacterium]
MERFLVGAALAAAALIAIGSALGPSAFQFHIEDDDNETVIEGAPLAAGAPQSFKVGDIDVRGAAALLTVTPEDRTDVEVVLVSAGKLPAVAVRQSGDRLILDGGLRRRVHRCSSGSPFTVSVSGIGDLTEADLTRIEIKTPRTLKLGVSDGVRATVGPSNGAELSFAGCAGGVVGDVSGPLEINSAGSGDVIAGAAQSAKANIAGSGAVTLGAVAQGLEVSIAGSGSTRATSVTGPFEASIAGSGDVDVTSGAITTAKVSIAGSGDVTIAAPVTELDASIMGSGDVDVASVSGAVKRSVVGSGGVSIGGVKPVGVTSGAATPPTAPTPPKPPQP